MRHPTQHEFHAPEALNSLKQQLDTAVKRPVYISHEMEYDDVWGEESAIHPPNPEPHGELSAVESVPTGEIVYVGSGNYDLIQHHEALTMLQSSIERTVGTVDFGMLRDYGTRIDGIIVLGNQEEANIDIADLVGHADYVPPEGSDAIDPEGNARWRDRMGLGVRFTNAFDGGRRLHATTMGYRAICQNWCVWDPQDIEVADYYHTGTGIDADFFDDIIEAVFDVKESVEPTIQEAGESEIPYEWVPGILADVGFPKSYQKEIGTIVDEQHDPQPGHTTQFNLWNAITTYLDGEKVGSLSQDTYDRHQRRAWEVLSMESIEAPDVEVELGESYPDDPTDEPEDETRVGVIETEA